MKTIYQNKPWTRSQDGWIAGVCQGLGERFDINPNVIRLMWVASILFLGFGVFAYLVFTFCLPVEGHEDEGHEPKILGVCYRLAKKMDIDLGLLRVLVVLISISSLGTAILAYIILHFLIPADAH